ncbi:MAG: MFS transporter [Armatimonadetes bacterium]|uniref:MFS transporter n=1 Tax=Candidatus Nitrosymbiomonas proteolyticus TaxID=2608984 RepID=A0A809R8D6_9BACT|nr:MFS transporter [Armatimonadota bacterium]MCK6632933.1 MFS transporter [Fimbriimonadaceae bacterium]BBO23843.1 MFS transporter [Candidatus Nitrosymbiomonas proteolyticus]NOG39686.1 MFS transporter [Armatimonadota bacterium]NUM39190.1 MFS transporter [Armatimonadota bacterium]
MPTDDAHEKPADGSQLRSPWSFVPVLYYLQGLPVMIIQGMAGVMYTKLGVDPGPMALWTNILKLPWMLKPLWGPLVELNSTKRKWIIAMQALIAVGLFASAYAITQSAFFSLSLGVFLVVAFLSSTHDIAADGFYLLALSKERQAFFVGIRSACFRLASLTATFALVYIAGDIEERTGNIPHSWFVALMVGATIYGLFAFVNAFALPRPGLDVPGKTLPKVEGEAVPFVEAFAAFFRQDRIFWILGFILFFRFGESMISTMSGPFLVAEPEAGGLGISTKATGALGGAVGVLSLTIGGILGGWLISKKGIRKTIWPMVFSLNLPNLFYIWLGTTRPESKMDALLQSAPENLPIFSLDYLSYAGSVLTTAITDPVGIAIAVDQFGYGFGFSAYLVYLMYVSQASRYKTSSYAIATGLMALGALIAGSVSGYIVQGMSSAMPGNGYLGFFWVVMACTIPGMITLFFIPLHYEDLKAKADLDG